MKIKNNITGQIYTSDTLEENHSEYYDYAPTFLKFHKDDGWSNAGSFYPERGDFVVYDIAKDSETKVKDIAIFDWKDKMQYYFYCTFRGLTKNEEWFIPTYNDSKLNMRLATKEEKSALIEALHKKGLDWDVENKRIIEKTNVVWHDLQKNPNDLPKDEGEKLVAKTWPLGGVRYRIAWYYKEDGDWLDRNNVSVGYPGYVIAWCELPKFEE